MPRQTEASPESCLDANVAAAFLHGALGEVEAYAVEGHVDRCSACRRHLSELVQSQHSHDTSIRLARRPGSFELRPGTRIGRYVLEAPLGAGAMGVVWSSYDTELARRVALKMLHGDLSSRAGAAAPDGRGRGLDDELENRLLREAQAMARLSHPNVVTVYDLLIHDQKLVLALELVDGVSLTTWLSSDKHPWRKVLGVFLDAGRGLAAAHAVGLVHRDFKPDNVLRDRAGRVAVTDFGLARLGGSTGVHGAGPSPDGTMPMPAVVHGISMTGTGALIGTPRYMAPEQIDGVTADARSDQFSFCVALYEALYGEHPFSSVTTGSHGGNAIQGLFAAVRSGRVGDAPRHAVVPYWIRKVLLKGLSVAPEERHASVEALLTALSSDPGKRQRRLGAVTTAAVLALGVFLVRPNFLVRLSSAAEPSCLGAEQKLSGIWDAAEKGTIHRAFLATDRPRAAEAWASVEHALDGYAREWTAERTEACTKTQGRGGLEPATLRRMTCLDDRLTELRGLTGILEHADAEIVTNALAASHSLAPVLSCRDPKAVASVLKPVEPRSALKVSELRQELATVTALTETHKLKLARPRARTLAEAAKGVGYAPLEAQALLAEATLLERAGEPDKAEPLLYRAAWLADAAADDRTRAVVWLRLLADIGLRQGESLAIVRDQAMAAYERSRDARSDDDLEIRYLGALANAAAGPGNLQEARSRTAEQVALLEKVYGDAHWKYATGLDALARYDVLLGDHESALRRLVHAREVLERAGAADTDLCTHVESTMGKSLLYLMRSSEAETHFRRAIEIEERTGLPNNQRLVVPLFNVGRALADQGRFDEAALAYERSIAIHRTMLPAMHPHFWEFYTALAGAELAQGKAAAALARLEPLLNLKEAQEARWFPATELFAAKALTALRRDPKRARKLAQSALDRLVGPSSQKGPRHDRELTEARAWIAEHGGA